MKSYNISITIIMLNFMIKITSIFSTNCFTNDWIKTYNLDRQKKILIFITNQYLLEHKVCNRVQKNVIY